MREQLHRNNPQELFDLHALQTSTEAQAAEHELERRDVAVLTAAWVGEVDEQDVADIKVSAAAAKITADISRAAASDHKLVEAALGVKEQRSASKRNDPTDPNRNLFGVERVTLADKISGTVTAEDATHFDKSYNDTLEGYRVVDTDKLTAMIEKSNQDKIANTISKNTLPDQLVVDLETIITERQAIEREVLKEKIDVQIRTEEAAQILNREAVTSPRALAVLDMLNGDNITATPITKQFAASLTTEEAGVPVIVTLPESSVNTAPESRVVEDEVPSRQNSGPLSLVEDADQAPEAPETPEAVDAEPIIAIVPDLVKPALVAPMPPWVEFSPVSDVDVEAPELLTNGEQLLGFKFDIGVAEKQTEGEDVIVSRPDLGLFSAIDGMGGEGDGNIAAKIIANSLVSSFEELDAAGTRTNILNAIQIMKNVLLEAQAKLLQSIKEGVGNQNMGAALTVLKAFKGIDGNNYAVYGHAGDTQLHILDETNNLEQITTDEGIGNVVFNSISGRGDLKLDQIKIINVPIGSRLALFTDGISGDFGPDRLDDKEIRQSLSLESPQDAANELLAVARKYDDASVIVVDMETDPLTTVKAAEVARAARTFNASEFAMFQRNVLFYGLIETKKMMGMPIAESDYVSELETRRIDNDSAFEVNGDKLTYKTTGERFTYESAKLKFGNVAVNTAFRLPVTERDYTDDYDKRERDKIKDRLAARISASLSDSKKNKPAPIERSRRIRNIGSFATRVVKSYARRQAQKSK